MNLSPDFVVEQLKNSYNIYAPNKLSTAPCLIYTTLYIPGMELKDHIAYIVKSTDLADLEDCKDFPQHSLFIIIGSTLDHEFANICSISDANDALLIFSELQELFKIYGTWQSDLMYIYFNDKCIQTMLSISAPVLNNSLFLVSMDFTIIAGKILTSPVFFKDQLDCLEFKLSHIMNLKNNELYHEVQELDGVFYFPKVGEGLACSCVNIKQNSKTKYRLVMLEDKQKIQKGENFLLQFLSILIQQIIDPNLVRALNQRNQENKNQENLAKYLLDILENEKLDYRNISQNLNAAGWLSSHAYSCIYIKLTKADIDNRTYEPIIHHLSNNFSNSCSFLYNDSVVTYINLSLSQMDLEVLVGRVENLSKECLLHFGISNNMLGHRNLRQQYLQAKTALSISMHNFPKKRVHVFNEITFDYILKQSTKEFPATMIVHDKLLRLMDSDKTKNTDYMKTLRLYLDNQSNTLKTSEELFIHRSTLIYRLNKIKEIIDSDLEDSDEILYIMLSFRLLESMKTSNQAL